MSRDVPGDRRREVRSPSTLLCKVRPVTGGRAIPGVTRDLSSHGALVELRWPTNVQAGEAVRVGVATPGTVLFRDEDLAPARVVRVLRGSGVTLIGLQFARAMNWVAAGAISRAAA
jgi:hypothetical protein